MVTEPRDVRIWKPEDLLGTYGASEILPQFLEIIRLGQGEDVVTEPVKDSPEIARDFEACRQALLSVDLLPLLVEIAVNQDVSDEAGSQLDVRENGPERHFVSQLISYVSGPTGPWLAETLLNAWTCVIRDIVGSSTYQETIVGALETYGASLIACDQVSNGDRMTMTQDALHGRLHSTHKRLHKDLAPVFAERQWNEDVWREVATKAFDGTLYSRHRYSVKFSHDDRPVPVEAVREKTPEAILARFITSVVRSLESAEDTRRDSELDQLISLLRYCRVFAIPFVRPWLGIQIPRDAAMLREGLAGEPGGCLFVLCCPKDLADREPPDLNRAALVMNWILNRAALIEARQQRVAQKQRDQVSSLHSLTTAILSVRGIARKARFALKEEKYREAATLVNEAESAADRLAQLREASVRARKVSLGLERPMVPLKAADGEGFLKVVDEIVQESIEASVGVESGKRWGRQEIQNKPSWASVSSVRYDESHLRLILPEALRNCVKHGNGQDSVSVEADTQTIEDKSYLVLTVSNGLKGLKSSSDTQRLQREIHERRHEKLGLYQMTEAALAWSLPPPELSVDVIKSRFSVMIYTAVKDIV